VLRDKYAATKAALETLCPRRVTAMLRDGCFLMAMMSHNRNLIFIMPPHSERIVTLGRSARTAAGGYMENPGLARGTAMEWNDK